jgi:hypothetical protein
MIQNQIESSPTPRKVFIILSSRALPYAEKGISSLFKNVLESIDLTLITDTEEDKKAIYETVSHLENPNLHPWQIFNQAEADERAEEQFKQYTNIKLFRQGHPCWRKITDPLLFSQDKEEMIILDPDLFFPNQFTFETTPQESLLLMRQHPNCLFPPESVIAAFDAPVKLAHHVDIGVAQVRKIIDLEWLDWFIGQLGGKDIPRIMHVEAIVWAAVAMKMGGGYLDPERWLCWHRSHVKRILIKLGTPGSRLLQRENLKDAKCFHACGMSKWWVKEACEAGLLKSSSTLNQPSQPQPFIELTRQAYDLEQNLKGLLWKIGYYSLINPD